MKNMHLERKLQFSGRIMQSQEKSYRISKNSNKESKQETLKKNHQISFVHYLPV